MRRLNFLIAFGPTREPLDPVRYLSNYSTGFMGRMLVSEARKRGHRVKAVECPKRVETARELEWLLQNLLPKADVLVMAAAVADVRPAGYSGAKIKKESLRSIRFTKNPDILAGLAKKKTKGQVFIGFGLESGYLRKEGLRKMRRKGLELIVLQKVTEKKTPFGNTLVDAHLMDRKGRTRTHRSITKRKLSGILVRQAEAFFKSLAR